MNMVDCRLTVLADGEPFASENRFRLSGTMRIGLFPSLFLLQCWNLSDSDVFRLQNTKELSVMREDSCLAFGRVSDVFTETVPEGTVTVVAFSTGLDLWESRVSLSVPAGVSVSETVRRILSASGTGIRLLSFPGRDPVFFPEPLPATLHLGERDLTDRPAFADGGRKMILSTTVTGFQPGEEMTLAWKGKTYSGLILERMTEADTGAGIRNTQLLIKRR